MKVKDQIFDFRDHVSSNFRDYDQTPFGFVQMLEDSKFDEHSLIVSAMFLVCDNKTLSQILKHFKI